MTSEIPTHVAPYPAAYAAPVNVYAAPSRPPLLPRQKRGAFWAGAVGFNLLSLGFGLVLIPVVAAIVGSFFAFLFEQIARNSENVGTGFLVVRRFFASLDYGILAILGIAVVLIGLAIMAGALFASRAILRAHGVERAWAVTWSGAGVAVVASWIVGWIPTLAIQFVWAILSRTELDGMAVTISAGGLGIILGIATTAITGWLAWWWMVHAFRSATVVAILDADTVEKVQR